MSDPLNQPLLEASNDPERITELLQGLAVKLSRASVHGGSGVQLVLEDFYLALQMAEKFCQTVADKARLESVLDLMPMSMIQVSPTLEILGLNQRAEALLAQAVYIGRRGNQIQALNAQSQQQLETLLANYAVPRAQPAAPVTFAFTSVVDPERRLPCHIYQQTRFDFEQEQTVSDVCFLINDGQDLEQQQNIVRYAKDHRLTDAESCLLSLLCDGHTAAQIAQLRHVSIHTVRTQLKTILRKTNAERQVQLIQLAKSYYPAVYPDGPLSPESPSLPAALNTHHYQLPDGRNLSYFDSGGPGLQTIVHCHGMFTSRLDPLNVRVFQQLRIRLIIPDRPGYGYSDPVPQQTLTGWAEDVVALMDHLGIGQFSMMAADFSSAFALATAHVAPQRVRDVVLLEGAAPVTEGMQSYDDDIPVYYKATFLAAQKMPKIVHKTTYIAYTLFARKPGKTLNRFLDIIGEDNARVIREPTLYSNIITAVNESIRQGVSALSANQVIMFSDWGFDLRCITCPVYLVVGKADALARYHGAQLQRELPNAVCIERPGSGWARMLYLDLAEVLEVVAMSETP